MRIPLPFILFLAAFAIFGNGPVSAGTLVLRDGTTLSGELRLAEGKVLLLPKGQAPKEFPLDQVTRVTFAADPANPAAETTIKLPTERVKSTDKDKDHQVRRILAEYFEDVDFKKRLAARYESSSYIGWGSSERPDPAVPSFCAVRYSARIVPDRTEDYTFIMEAHGQMRLWVADKLMIDNWTATAHHLATDPIKMTAGQPVDLRWEVVSGRYGFSSHLLWRSPSVTNPWIKAEAFLPPTGASEGPTATLLSPEDGLYFRAPSEIVVEAEASVKQGKIAKLELVMDKTIVGEFAKPPYKFAWKNAPAGYHKIAVKATDDQGISSTSPAISIAISGSGKDQSLPAPWGEQTIFEKKHEKHPVGLSTYVDGVFTLTKAGGQIPDNDDECHFIHQPVKGDFTLIARLSSLTPPDAFAGPLAGIIMKERLSGEGRFASILVGAQSVVFSRKVDSWGKASNNERLQPPPPGAKSIDGGYLKLQRHENRIRAFTSHDGNDWEILANDRIELPEQLFVGLCAQSRSLETPAVATFDRVSLVQGAPEMASTAKGILFRTGTFLACDVSSVKENLVYYSRVGEKQTVPIADVARLIYRPITAELAGNVPSGQTGIMLASGDFAEGEVKEINYRVVISNLVFGPRTFNLKGTEVLAIFLKQPEPAKTRYTLTTADGSTYRSATLKIEKETVGLEDATFGALSLQMPDLAEIRIQ